MRRWCAGVFAGVVGVHLCVLGVCYVITYPKPNPKQAQHLMHTLFRSAYFFHLDQSQFLWKIRYFSSFT